MRWSPVESVENEIADKSKQEFIERLEGFKKEKETV